MPTYEFRCPSGHEFERFYRKISDGVPELPCPDCGAVAARQLSGGGGLLFKGSGFYLTDYGKNAHAKRGDAKAGDGAKPEGTKAEGGGKEAKSETAAKPEGGAKGEPKKAEPKAEPKPATKKKTGEG
ncbi:MAG TPA: zinc ribbon domain-containing protein [Gemmatimonadaceae bacterium]|nr:zinc ribbon domain-containing protein [Gemmatimonadaceae bacterium]